jgi:Prokaryotic membrane lipoprotein lipid attachment site
MKKIFFILVLVLSLSGCVSVSPYVLSKNQTNLDLSKNRGVALFTLKIKNSGSTRLLLSSFAVREANQYKPYNTLGSFYIPLMSENYSAADDLYFCTVVLNRGIYRLDSFSGLTNSFFSFPYTLKADGIFDVYPNTINYIGRLDFGDLDTKVVVMTLKGKEDAYVQDVEKFKAIFPVLKDKEIGKDSFY